MVVPEFRSAENPTFSTESADGCLSRKADVDPKRILKDERNPPQLASAHLPEFATKRVADRDLSVPRHSLFDFFHAGSGQRGFWHGTLRQCNPRILSPWRTAVCGWCSKSIAAARRHTTRTAREPTKTRSRAVEYARNLAQGVRHNFPVFSSSQIKCLIRPVF